VSGGILPPVRNQTKVHNLALTTKTPGWKPDDTAAKDGCRYWAVPPVAPKAAQFSNASIDQNHAGWHHSRPT
jgi:hypothetical protein